jgi:non-heme chloroperoxidase
MALAAEFPAGTVPGRGRHGAEGPASAGTYAAGPDNLLTGLDLRNPGIAGHSMGSGEIARYLGSYRSEPVRRAAISAVEVLQELAGKAGAAEKHLARGR